MRSYKNLTFCEGISCTLAEFKKDFAPHLTKLSESEIKEAHKAAVKGNGFPRGTKKSKKANANKGKE